ncbi:hypothetical protein EWH99_03055 [Sporolactobacillus sp. THM7-7]|nr:hypothetical protein EWH99_03055 [Sporolactobacillus sp. THM7-7]
MSLKHKLQLYKKQLHDAQQAATTHQKEQHEDKKKKTAKRESREKEMERAAQGIGAQIRRLDEACVLVHAERVDLKEKIGPYSAADLFHTVRAWQTGSRLHPLSASGLRCEDLLFFDTETTGLGSGTGELIFLIGFARVEKNAIEIKQYFLPGPGHEAAFYDAFLRDCRSLKNLVTFNGKAFDWPRVKTRHRFVRDQVPRLPAFGHFDLLHASRRLWKSRLDSVRLQTVESEILGMRRERDVPGKMAPFLYFKFLKQPDANLVKGILEHNREDVLSLIALYTHLSKKVLGLAENDTEETFEIARWYLQVGDDKRAVPLLRKLSGTETREGARAKTCLAKWYKREGKYARALTMFQSAIRALNDPDDTPYIEAAKIMEHQYKDYEKALQYTLKAMEYLDANVNLPKEKRNRREADCIKRIHRLDGKLMRNKG